MKTRSGSCDIGSSCGSIQGRIPRRLGKRIGGAEGRDGCTMCTRRLSLGGSSSFQGAGVASRGPSALVLSVGLLKVSSRCAGPLACSRRRLLHRARGRVLALGLVPTKRCTWTGHSDPLGGRCKQRRVEKKRVGASVHRRPYPRGGGSSSCSGLACDSESVVVGGPRPPREGSEAAGDARAWPLMPSKVSGARRQDARADTRTGRVCARVAAARSSR